MVDFATEDSGRYWWWPRAVWTDPNEIIADDDEGGLWRVPFSSSDGQEITFGDPVRVLETFEDAPAQAKVAATMAMHSSAPRARWSSRSQSPAAARDRGGSAPSSRNRPMDSAAALRQALRLPADASDADCEAALAAQAAEATGPGEPGTPPTPLTGGETAPGAEEPVPAPEPTEPVEDPTTGAPENPEVPATSTGDEGEVEENDEGDDGDGEGEAPEAAADGTVRVDAATWAETQRQAREGAAARAEQRTERREALLSDAVKAGKFPPSRIDHYRKLHSADAKGTEKLIADLAAGTVPVTERGTAREDIGGDAEFAAVMSTFGGSN